VRPFQARTTRLAAPIFAYARGSPGVTWMKPRRELSRLFPAPLVARAPAVRILGGQNWRARSAMNLLHATRRLRAGVSEPAAATPPPV